MSRDFADPYIYPGTGVLRNRWGIKDEKALREFEYEQSALRLAELRERPVAGRFDLQHLQAIHRHVFGEVYDWAGEVRVVNISKGGTTFANPAFIESQGRVLAAAFEKDNSLRGLQKPVFVERAAHYFAEWNALHPFREGNGRSTREFIAQMARAAGYEFDQTRIRNEQGQWNEAARRSFHGDLSGLKEIFDHSLRPARAVAIKKSDRSGVVISDAVRAPEYETGAAKRLQVHAPEAAPEHARKPARAKAFQAVADNRLSRDDALKLFPELRASFNQLVVVDLKYGKRSPAAEQLRAGLQRELDVGRVPAPAASQDQRRSMPERLR